MLAVLIAVLGFKPTTAMGVDTQMNLWPRTSEIILDPDALNGDIVHAAGSDLAARGLRDSEKYTEFAGWLVSVSSKPDQLLEAARGVEILKQFRSVSGRDSHRFWPLFNRATLEQLAGDHQATASTLAMALRYATDESVPPHIIATAAGFMGHAQYAVGMPDKAMLTFRRLLSNPTERVHATVHLGRILFTERGIDAALDMWLSTPRGLAAAASAISAVADEQWLQNPARAYRLVAMALERIDRNIGQFPAAQAAIARTRLMARTRKNAIAHVPK